MCVVVRVAAPIPTNKQGSQLSKTEFSKKAQSHGTQTDGDQHQDGRGNVRYRLSAGVSATCTDIDDATVCKIASVVHEDTIVSSRIVFAAFSAIVPTDVHDTITGEILC